ncbi:MAG: oxygen-independent coproporphyrinogen III oxidase [Proteobacteria bacterium]|nr:oxygen-independent coproporphyrinogen III oxidase [Pseudomonadota bacterium]
MKGSVIISGDLIKKYDFSGPRYTSYPTAVQFTENFKLLDYKRCVHDTNSELIPRSLSLYIHLPFCDTVCYYCACNKIITKNKQHAKPYLENLHKEIKYQGKIFDGDRVVEQLHWGGGTPTFISHQQMYDLMGVIRENFKLSDNGQEEYSIEIDPRTLEEDTLSVLRRIGFNKISFGVQDFNQEVQKAVNRIQSYEETKNAIKTARENNFCTINIDLIYGLPLQTESSFTDTIERVIELSPERISVYNYAHLPHLFKTQKQIREGDLPSTNEKLRIIQQAIRMLTEAGYVYIGMDHFSKPDDELAIAQKNGNLYRNFQGYSTHANCDVVGMGITSISKIGDCYSQNVKTLDEYDEIISRGKIPVLRGYMLDTDDLLRREIIARLICHFRLEFDQIEELYINDFNRYFFNEMKEIKSMENDGLLSVDNEKIEVSRTGRFFIRNICSVFDKYFNRGYRNTQFSRMV